MMIGVKFDELLNPVRAPVLTIIIFVQVDGGGIEDSNTVGHVRNTINHAVGTQDASTVLVVRGDSGRNVDDGEGP